MLRETVYSDHDNEIALQLSNDNGDGVMGYTDLTNVTRVVMQFFDGTSLDSDVDADVFDWDDDPTNGILKMTLGNSGLEEGSHRVCLVLYWTTLPNGVRWDTEISIKVKEH